MKRSDPFTEFSGLFHVFTFASATRWTINRAFPSIEVQADTAPGGLVINVLLHCTQL